MGFCVVFERALQGKALAARNAPEGLCVRAEVLAERRGVAKSGAARPARVRLLARVPPHVLGQRRRLREGGRAEDARKRLFAGVAPLVLGAVGNRRERAGAPRDRALHALGPHAPPRVHRQQRPPRKPPPAHTAAEAHSKKCGVLITKKVYGGRNLIGKSIK